MYMYIWNSLFWGAKLHKFLGRINNQNSLTINFLYRWYSHFLSYFHFLPLGGVSKEPDNSNRALHEEIQLPKVPKQTDLSEGADPRGLHAPVGDRQYAGHLVLQYSGEQETVLHHSFPRRLLRDWVRTAPRCLLSFSEVTFLRVY